LESKIKKKEAPHEDIRIPQQKYYRRALSAISISISTRAAYNREYVYYSAFNSESS